MMLRSAAVVAGLALGLMSGAAQSASVTYDISTPYGGNFISGTIVTNGAAGLLSVADVTSYDLVYAGSHVSANPSQLQTYGHPTGLYAFQTNLAFDFEGQGFSQFYGGTGYVAFEASDTTGSRTGTVETNINSTVFYEENKAGLQIIGTSSINVGGSSPITVPSVPLPSSAPMFGAALFTLAGLGYAAKRKKAAAAA